MTVLIQLLSPYILAARILRGAISTYFYISTAVPGTSHQGRESQPKTVLCCPW